MKPHDQPISTNALHSFLTGYQNGRSDRIIQHTNQLKASSKDTEYAKGYRFGNRNVGLTKAAQVKG
jgi:hypothetical protein